jgi:thiol-disulfide isomerase/thioredoxin
MGGLTDLATPTELQEFIKSHNSGCVVTFSAHWCGPCRSSKPQLEAVAKDSPLPFGYTLESDLGDFLHTFQIKAFPTYVCFVGGTEVQRVQGVNFAAIQEMVSAHASAAGGASMPGSGGTALGGGGTTVSPEEARQLRLAKLGATAAPPPPKKEEAPTPMETEDKPAAAADTSMEVEETTAKNPVDELDPAMITTLTGEMGFTLIRAQKGLLFSSGGTVESAVEWLMEHQDDADIDAPIPEGAGSKAQSYKCNDCGKVLSNMANLELHANKTGHSDFAESTQSVKPLSPEEKAAKIAEIKELLKAKRAEREEAEKVDHVEREKQRRFMGKEVAKTREEMDREQRKRDTKALKREKDSARKERERIRAELEKDKLERRANNGKLKSNLGVDGYNPSAIQYDDGTVEEHEAPSKPKKAKADAGKIDEYIKKVSSYRAGGDGGKCLKILKAYVGNAADNPNDDKFKMINMENKAFKTKVKPFIGAKLLLNAVGFSPKEGDPTTLELQPNADLQLLKNTKEKLIKASEAFG